MEKNKELHNEDCPLRRKVLLEAITYHESIVERGEDMGNAENLLTGLDLGLKVDDLLLLGSSCFSLSFALLGEIAFTLMVSHLLKERNST